MKRSSSPIDFPLSVFWVPSPVTWPFLPLSSMDNCFHGFFRLLRWTGVIALELFSGRRHQDPSAAPIHFVCVSCIHREQPPSVAGSTTTCQEASTPWVSTWSTSSCMVASPSSPWTSSLCCLVVCSTPVRAGGYTWRPELPCWRHCCLLSIPCTLSV